MNKEQRNSLEKRMYQIRRSIQVLSKFGMGTKYYTKELAILENIVRKTRMEIEFVEMQLRIELENSSSSDPVP